MTVFSRRKKVKEIDTHQWGRQQRESPDDQFFKQFAQQRFKKFPHGLDQSRQSATGWGASTPGFLMWHRIPCPNEPVQDWGGDDGVGRRVEMGRERKRKCPQCREGVMKMVLATTPLDTAKEKPMQAKCHKCGFEDDYTKIYPRKAHQSNLLLNEDTPDAGGGQLTELPVVP